MIGAVRSDLAVLQQLYVCVILIWGAFGISGRDGRKEYLLVVSSTQDERSSRR